MSFSTPEPLEKISRDVRRAAATLGRDEARFLVDQYYSLQDFRISSTNQVRSIVQSEKEEPHETLEFFGDQFIILEKDIAKALDTYSNAHALGVWAREHVGIGPVIAAGLLAHIDVTKAPSASSVWRFAGLAPGQKKQKGVKRDWNSDLKVLCWKMGDSFVKFSGKDNCYYGKLYRQRKKYEIKRNAQVKVLPKGIAEQLIYGDAEYLKKPDEEHGQHMIVLNGEAVTVYRTMNKDGELINWVYGGNAMCAATTLNEINIREKATRERYEAGMLPDGRIDMRARRYAVKRFLLHYWECAYQLHYEQTPPHPYVQEFLGHTDIQPSPIPFPEAA